MSKNLFIDEKLSAGEADIGIAEAFRRLLPFLKEQRRRLFLAMALLAGVTGFSLLWPVLVQRAIDGPLLKQLELSSSERDFDPVLWYGLAVILIQLSTIVMQYWQRVKLEIVGQDIMLKLKEKLFDHIMALDVSFFDKNPVGRLMARIESDTESLRLLFTFTVVAVVGDIVLMTGIYIVMFIMSWKLALVLLLFAPAFAVLVYIFHKLTSHRYLRLRKRSAEVTAALTEFLHG
ncbi:MAG TPA: ABC transporter transmembrane domain-containing protein, partial [candidate division Zixibacteria bacterium]|nr:ABC transporter transmembrane domain-containing protein [candidate division Zixibacteria bacterium]